VRGADVAFVSDEAYVHGAIERAPDLIVEVLSPNDRWGEVTQKLHEYFSIGVRLVWVADPETRAALNGTLRASAPGAAAGTTVVHDCHAAPFGPLRGCRHRARQRSLFLRRQRDLALDQLAQRVGQFLGAE
jgi:hypothetical protein